MLNRELIVAYLKTIYWVETPAAAIPVRIGQNCPDLDTSIRHITGASDVNWAIVTAHNPQSKLLAPSENRRRHAALVNSLETSGPKQKTDIAAPSDTKSRTRDIRVFWPAISVDPTGLWYPETGLCLIGYDEAEVRHIMSTWEQAAVVFGRTGEPATLLFAQPTREFAPDLNTLLGEIAASDGPVSNAATHIINWHRCRFSDNPTD